MNKKITKYFIIIIALLTIFLLIGCAKQQSQTTKITGKTTAETNEPTIDRSYNTKTRTTQPTTTATKTTTTTQSTEMTYEQEEAKAIDAAKAFVKNLDGYANQNGRGLQIISTVKTSCEGCWLIDLRFERDRLYYPDKNEFIKVHTELKKLKVDTYTFK